MEQDLPDDEIIIDGALLGRIARRQLRAWLLIGPALFAAFMALGLCLVPQSFTSTTSVAVQQPGGSSVAQSLLGAATPPKRYLGFLKSRKAAEAVERRVNLQRLYDFDSRRDAVEFLMKHVSTNDDAADGLLYIDVTLPGPPLLAPAAAARHQEVKDAATLAANAYADALHDYYVNSDTERDTVLLRGADVELRRARADFDRATTRLQNFARSLGRYDPRAAPSPGAEVPGVGPTGAGVTETARLYDALAQVQAQIRAAEAAQAAQRRGVGSQLNALGEVPDEDPLLADARDRVLRDQTDLKNLRVQLGPDNPRVVVARERLRIDEAALDRQVQGVRRNLTTQHVLSASELESLRARQATLEGQVAQADRRLRVNRTLSAEFGRLQTEAAIRLEALKATTTEAARVRLENVSAQSRMSVVDEAIPSRHGKPGALMLAGISLALVMLGFVLAVLREYRSRARDGLAPPGIQPTPTAPPANGARPETRGASGGADETAEKTTGRRQ